MLDEVSSYSQSDCAKIFSEDGTKSTTFFNYDAADDEISVDDEATSYPRGWFSCGNVFGNAKGSYLTMISINGLKFGIINTVGNFGTVFVDQSYWQSAIAAKPSAAHKGYLLGGMVWFTIPFALATAMGLAGVALQLPITKGEAGQGLVPPAVATHLFGTSGSWMVAIMLFMAIVSTGSAESIAVSSIIQYDVYRAYINPSADGEAMKKVGRWAIAFWGIFMGCLSALLQAIVLSDPTGSFGLGWVYQFMGNAIGSAVPPLFYLTLWKDASATGAILGCALGFIAAMIAWFVTASTMEGGVSIANLGSLDANLAGNLCAIFVSWAVHYVHSINNPQDFDWKKFDDEIQMVEDDNSGLDPEDYSDEELDKAYSWVVKWGSSLSFVLLVVWPCLSLPAGMFTKEYFAFWVFIALVWGFVASVVIIVLPIYESWTDIKFVIDSIRGVAPTEAAHTKVPVDSKI